MKNPKSIILTGASSGIGAALAEAYAAPHVALALGGRNGDRLEAVAEVCRRKGAVVDTRRLDVRDADAVTDWIHKVDHQSPVDLLIANAGITSGISPARPVETGAAARTVISVNLIGAINTVDPIVEAMRQRRHGQIALIGSLAGFYGLPYSPAYSASKAGLRAYAQALRAGLADRNVHVSIVCPGFVKSPLDDSVRSAKPFRLSAEKAAKIIKNRLARRHSQIAFPLPLHVGARTLGLLPTGLAVWILNRISVEIPEPSSE